MIRSITFCSLFFATVSHGAPPVIDDLELLRGFHKELETYASDDSGPTVGDLYKAVGDAPLKLDLELPDVATHDNPDASVYLIGSVNLCGKCDKWHPSGKASAWALSSDGIMVTNHHVFKEGKEGAIGVCGIDGKTHRVTEILAADPANDIAIFRVDAKGLKPLPIGDTAPVGEQVEVVSHPNGRFFTHTFGHVSRYHKRPQNPKDPGYIQMSITADYAKGSSGAPVLNGKGKVVGMVRSTQSIYYKAPKGENPGQSLQMVVKDCVPISAIHAMFPNRTETTAAGAKDME